MAKRNYAKITAGFGAAAVLVTLLGLATTEVSDLPTRYFYFNLILLLGVILYFEFFKDYKVTQELTQSKALRRRLKEELEFIRTRIEDKMNHPPMTAEAMFTELFALARPQLVAVIDAKTWEKVIRAYQAIDTLRLPNEQTKEHYLEVLRVIDLAIGSL